MPQRAYNLDSMISMVSSCGSEKSLYARKKSFKKEMCRASRVDLRNVSGAVLSVSSFQLRTSSTLMRFSPAIRSMKHPPKFSHNSSNSCSASRAITDLPASSRLQISSLMK